MDFLGKGKKKRKESRSKSLGLKKREPVGDIALGSKKAPEKIREKRKGGVWRGGSSSLGTNCPHLHSVVKKKSPGGVH